MRIEPNPESHMPYPELVEKRVPSTPYRIRDANESPGHPSNGMVDLREREMLVPLSPSGRPVSRHELAHVKWSPRKLPRIRFDAHVLMAVEDARINLGLDSVGLRVELTSTERAEVVALAASDLTSNEIAMFVLRSIAAIGTSVEESIRTPAEDADPEIRSLVETLTAEVRRRLDRGRRPSGCPVASFRTARRVAKDVARRLEALGLLEKRESHGAPVCSGCCFGESRGGGGHGLSHEERRAFAALRGGMAGAGVEPGRMTLDSVPLDVRTRRVIAGRRRRWRPGTEGSVVRWIHRHPIDGAIFRRPAPRHGCTVLIDASGSMSLGVADIDRIITEAPAATLIAMYSGRGEAGQLRIVARDGRRAREEHLEPFGGGNIVDVPALEWLAKQGGPRVWISDGHVTGEGDRSTPEIRRRCRRICRRGRIRRVRTAVQAARVLSSRS